MSVCPGTGGEGELEFRDGWEEWYVLCPVCGAKWMGGSGSNLPAHEGRPAAPPISVMPSVALTQPTTGDTAKADATETGQDWDDEDEYEDLEEQFTRRLCDLGPDATAQLATDP